MTVHVLLTELRSRGVALSAAAGRLHVEAPRGALTPELRAGLSSHKGELLARGVEDDAVQAHFGVNVGQQPLDTLLNSLLPFFTEHGHSA